jgi:ABC-type sugar transport system substrate-binding protein
MHRHLNFAVSALVLFTVVFAATGSQFTNAQSKSHYAAFIPPALTNPFHVEMVDGMKAETSKAGWKLDVQAPASESDFAGFVTIVQREMEKGVEIISINPSDTDSAVTAVKAANALNVPILVHNFITPFKEGNVISYIGYDQWGGAKKLGEYACHILAKKNNTTPEQATGKVFILLGIDGSSSHRRTGGFKDGLKMCPGVEVVGEQTADWLRENGAAVATTALQKEPDIDIFYGNSDEMNIGAVLAAEKLGRKPNVDIWSIGIDGNKPTLDLIKEGKVTATLGVDPYRMGVAVFQTMVKVLNGEKVPQVLLTPSVVVDASNLDDYLAGKTWTDPVEGAPELDNDQPTVPETPATMEPTMAATESK